MSPGTLHDAVPRDTAETVVQGSGIGADAIPLKPSCCAAVLGALLAPVFLLFVVIPLLQVGARHSVAANSGPVIEALDAYQADHGAPPETLGALVPDYLTSAPGFGLAGSSHVVYTTYPDATGDRRWGLRVYDLFEGWMIDGDFLFYDPEPRPGAKRRYGDWTHVRR